MRYGLVSTGGMVAALMLVLVAAGDVGAQQPTTLTFQVTENRAPGAAGTATVTPLPNNQIRVEIRLTGMPPNTQHAAHIHTAAGARCDTNAPVTYPLTDVAVDASGVGSSTTTVTLTADRPVQAGNAYVNVHQAVTPPGPGVICADVTASFTAAGAAPAGQAPAPAAPPAAPQAGQQPVAMPPTGTGGLQGDEPSAWLIASLTAMAVLLGGATLAIARRR